MKSKANRRSSRTIIQFILGGGLTAILVAATNGLSPFVTTLVFASGSLAFTWAQNYAEDHEIIPVILPAPPPESPHA